MTTHLSWRPINFRRWNSLAAVLGDLGGMSTSALSSAILGMKVSWERLAEDLHHLFLPSGPPGTHAAHHFHGPPDPAIREQVLAAAAADYETSLMYLDIALQLTVQHLYAAVALGATDWPRLVRAAEQGVAGLATDAHDTILYLQRTPLYVRNDAIVHPQSLVPLTGFDNVGNLSLLRLSTAEPAEGQLEQLDELVHRVRPDLRPNLVVGQDIPPTMALNWVGTVSYTVDEWRQLNDLRAAFGFLLPGAYEIGPRVDQMVDHVIDTLPDSELKSIVFAAGPTARRPVPAVDDVPAARAPDRERFAALLEEGINAGEAGEAERAAEIFRQCVELDPEEGVAHFCLGQELIALDQLEEGLEYVYRAQAIGWDRGEVRRRLIQGHFNLGARYFGAREFERSLPHYRRVHELDPTDLEAHRHLMEALAYGGELDEAFLHAGMLLRDHPGNPDVQLNVSAVFHQAGNDQQALHYAEKAVELRPDWDQAVEGRDALRRRLGVE